MQIDRFVYIFSFFLVINFLVGGTDPGSPKRLRLNHVKRLARAVHSTVKESASHKSKE